MGGNPVRVTLTAIDTAEIDPADPAASWRRNNLAPRPADPDIELEVELANDGELVAVAVAESLGGGMAAHRDLRFEKDVWMQAPAEVIRRGVLVDASAREYQLEPTLAGARERQAQDGGAAVARGRLARRARSEAYVRRLPRLFEEGLELEAQCSTAPPEDADPPEDGDFQTALERALHGPLGPPLPRSRRGKVREIDPVEVELLREEEKLTHWAVADRLGVDLGSPAKATYRARKRRRQIGHE